MSILGYYWNDANQGSWQDFLNQGSWLNYTVNDQTVISESFILPVTEINFSCNDTTITDESFSVFATRKDYYKSMTDSLPDYYRESTDVDLFKKMAESELKELGFKGSKINDAMHVSNATPENIDRFEKEYGLTTDKTLGFIFRKNVLLANYYTVVNDSTEDNLKKVLEIMQSIEISFVLIPARKLTISLNNNVLYLPELTKLSRKFIPAHLGLDIIFSDPWNFILTDGAGDWQNSLDNYTWGSFLN